MVDERTFLEAKDLAKGFTLEGGKKGKNVVRVVSGMDLKICEGETLALVGESRYGRSTLGWILIRFLDVMPGTIEFDRMDIIGMRDKELTGIRQQIQITFQDPYVSLNPRVNMEEIISEPLTTYGLTKNRVEVRSQVRVLVDGVGISREFTNRYPHQFSDRQRQRIGIAKATTLHPRLVICNESVPVLGVPIQSQALNLLKDLQEQYQLTYLFTSHSLGMIKFISDRVYAAFLGVVCEVGNTRELYNRPLHPYTRFLLNAVPKADPRLRSDEQELLTREIPSPVNPPLGCRFCTRCPYAEEVYSQKVPKGTMVKEKQVFCYFPLT